MKEEIEGAFTFRVVRMSNKAIFVDVFYGTPSDKPFETMQRIGDLVLNEESWARFSSLVQMGANSLVHEVGDLRIVPVKVILLGEFRHSGGDNDFQEFPRREDDNS